MTEQQRVFCDEFVRLNNGAEAARSAGYSPKNARQTASDLLTIPDIQEYILQKRLEAARRRNVSIDSVICGLLRELEVCSQLIPVYRQTPDGPVQLLNKAGEPVFRSLNSSGVLKCHEMLGRYCGAWESAQPPTFSKPPATIEVVGPIVNFPTSEDQIQD